MEVPEKLQTFPAYFIVFLESAVNFEHVDKKVSLMAQGFLKLLTPKGVFTYTYKRSCFWKFFSSEGVNESLKLLKSAQKYFYYTFSSVWWNLR